MPPILAVVLCGSVDDGKSTVLGRILYDSGQVSVDRMQSVEEDSRLYGTQGDSSCRRGLEHLGYPA